MDSPNSPNDSSIAFSSRKRTAEEDDLMAMATPLKRLRFTPSKRPYTYTLPDSVMYYIAKNATSPAFYQKLVKACKYIFEKNPVLCTDWIFIPRGKSELTAEFYETNVSLKDILKKDDSMALAMPLKKLWITGDFTVDPGTPIRNDFVSSFIPRIHRIAVQYLDFCDQILSLEEFLFLTPNVERVQFENLTVKNRDGTELAFVKLLEILPKVWSFTYFIKENDKTVTSKTVEEMLKLPNFSMMGEFRLFNVPETFDVEAFFTHMKKCKNTMFQLRFSNSISQAYKNRLETIIDEIIDAETHGYIAPMIYFDDMDQERFDDLSKICCDTGFFY
uniref:DUF38 domain-containing protein n=1 Tax=Panagrolaimus sp. ES5 TaxID=591445 RepID=A0AC34F3G6_9BILA